VRKRLFHCSAHASGGYSSCARYPSPFPCQVPYPQDHGLPLGDYLREQFISCTRKRVLFHWIGDFWKVICRRVKRVPEGESGLKNKSSDLSV